MQTQATPWILKKWTGFVFRSWSLLFIHHLCFVILHGFFRDLWYFKQEWIMHFVLYWCSNLYIFLCTKIQSESKQNELLEILITIKDVAFNMYFNLHALRLKIIPNYCLKKLFILMNLESGSLVHFLICQTLLWIVSWFCSLVELTVCNSLSGFGHACMGL